MGPNRESAGKGAGKRVVLARMLAKVLFLHFSNESALANTFASTPASTPSFASTFASTAESDQKVVSMSVEQVDLRQ